MNVEYILKELKNQKQSQIPFRVLFDIAEFKTGKEESSSESLLLALGGHKPTTCFHFDINKITEWCHDNNIDFVLNEKEQMLYLRLMKY